MKAGTSICRQSERGSQWMVAVTSFLLNVLRTPKTTDRGQRDEKGKSRFGNAKAVVHEDDAAAGAGDRVQERIDLVILVESPTSVARGLQRVGRAGHQVGAPSKARVFPKHRGDLLETAVVVERMYAGAIEETSVPSNPLDVVAQHIVAMAAVEDLDVDETYSVIRRALPFRDLTRPSYEAVLDMLAGR